MKDHYQVKWQDPQTGKMHFGIFQRRDGFSYKQQYAKLPKGKCIVEDAVLPNYHVVDEKILIDIKSEFDPPDAYVQHVQACEAAAVAKSNALPKGVHVGAMFAVGVADGQAWYVVTKVNKKTCKVEWRGFCLDRWTDHHFGLGGTFPIFDIARYVGAHRDMGRLFAKK